MKITVTNHIQQSNKSGYSATVNHNRHDPNIKHSNKDIDPNLRQYNVLDQGKDRREELEAWQEKKFGAWIENHDRLQREKGHGERQYGSVQNWLQPQNKPIGILTIGSLESTNDLMRKVIPEELLTTRELPNGVEKVSIKTDTEAGKEAARKFYGVYQKAYQDFVIQVNEQLGNRPDNGQFIGRYAIHCDELGAPHLHYELGAFSYTAKGKGSASLDRAIRQMAHKTGKGAMAVYRNATDTVALIAFNDALRVAYGSAVTLELTRKTKEDPTLQTGLSMEQVKAIHQEEAKAKAAADKLCKEISAKTETLNNLADQERTLRAIRASLDDQVKELDNQITDKTAQVEDLSKTFKRRLDNRKHLETQIDQLEAVAEVMEKTQQLKNDEYNKAKQRHQAVMAQWEAEEEEAQARYDKLLMKNHKQEQKNALLSADLEALKTAIEQRSGLLDQLNNQLRQWINKHIKHLLTMALNLEGGKAWMKEHGGGYMVQQQYRQDYSDDLDRLMSGHDVPKRYYKHPGMGWSRRTYQRNQCQQVQTNTLQDDGPDL